MHAISKGVFDMTGNRKRIGFGTLRDWRDDSRGNTAVIFGLAIIPLVFAAGAAVDTIRVIREQTALAAAIDTAALAVATSPRSNLSGLGTAAKAARIVELKDYAKKYILKNYTPVFHDDTDIGLVIDITDTMVTLTASHDFPTTLMAMSGRADMKLNATAEITKGGTNIEVALILDNTGSMAGSRITNLKVAAKDFVDIVVKTTQTPFYSKVAIVPYSMGVNVGNTYATAARGSVINGISTTPGHSNYRFKNTDNKDKTFAISTCVSERTGSEAFTDAPVSANKVGRNYAAPANPCATGIMSPLSSSKTALNASIDAMVASGSTAGQVGVAWGWYTLSPTFGLWTGNSVPASYGASKLKKVAVLMTDGEYNSPYCTGVISRDATNGSGDPLDHINCNATNGNVYTQSQNLCNAMKAKGITVYTVAFQLTTGSTAAAAQALMTNCATSPSYRYDAANETELRTVFKSIANDLLTLRISK